MMDLLPDATWAALAGLLGGLVLGFAARFGRFCTLGAIEDAAFGGDDGRLRQWVLAIALAIAGSFALAAGGLIQPDQSFYLNLPWNPLASVTGGLMFGYGMALAGNCGYGVLARLGGGDLKALVVAVVMGISAYMALAGPTAVVRAWIFPVARAPDGEIRGIAHSLGAITGLSPLWPALLIAAAMAFWALRARRFRHDLGLWGWSPVVAFAIASGWVATQWLASNGFGGVPLESHTFSAPMGEAVMFLMTSTGMPLTFGIGSVAGVILGALLGSLIKGQFRWEACEDPRELGRVILGGFLMGTGAVTAAGCSVGQGLSAFSLLSYSAPIVLLSIGLGAWIGLRQLISGLPILGGAAKP